MAQVMESSNRWKLEGLETNGRDQRSPGLSWPLEQTLLAERKKKGKASQEKQHVQRLTVAWGPEAELTAFPSRGDENRKIGVADGTCVTSLKYDSVVV